MTKEPLSARLTENNRPFVVQFAGSAVLIDCADPAVCRPVLEHLDHCRGGDLAATPLPASRFRIEAEDERAYRLLRDGAIVCAGLTASDAAVRLVYEVTLALAAECRSHLVFHAAGLARDGQGVILCGESGRGKSTLATRLVAAGFDFLSDELVAVAPEAAEMLGFPRAIGLKDLSPFAGQPGMGELARESEPRPAGGVAYFNPNRLRPGCVRHRAWPAVLVFPRYTPTAPEGSRRLSPAEAAYHLLGRLVNGPSLADQGFAVTAGLARALPAYGLTYSNAGRAVAWFEQSLC